MNRGNNVSWYQTMSKVMHIIGRHKFYLILSILICFVTVVLTLYAPVLFGSAIDMIVDVVRSKEGIRLSSFAQLLTQILIIIVMTGIFTWIMNIINNHITFETVKDIRAKAVRKIQVLPLKYLDGHSSGDIISRVITDTDQIADGLLLGLTQLFSGVFTIIITLWFMFTKSVSITLLVIICTPVSFLVARFIASKSYTMFKKQTYARGEQTALIEEMIGNEKVIKAFNYENRASERFSKINSELQEYSEKAVFFSSLTNPSTRAVNNVIYALVALSGAKLIIAGNLSVGGLSVLLAYANQYMKPFNDISSVITELQNALACANRVFELLEADEEIPEVQAQLPEVNGFVEIQDVYFSYNPDKPFIEHFNLHVNKGMHIAIVGPTGCGKTTFINLLMRFYDIDQGTIQIEGTDIRNVTRHSLRSAFGMVLQETWLKNGTIRENILFAKPDATEEEIINAAKEAHSWEFIKRLPDQLDTVITEDSLSAGQKQLLCITRVMLALPPMLILDEATSAIDTRTELQIQNAFDKLMEDRTSFVVAHRLSTIRNADIILVMKDGRIIEQGTHDALMKQNGFYTGLYNSQFAGRAI